MVIFGCLLIVIIGFKLTLYLIETPFNTFAKQTQIRQLLYGSGSTLFAYGNMIR